MAEPISREKWALPGRPPGVTSVVHVPEYSVTVIATDSSSLSAEIAVTIRVINVDEDGTVTLFPTQPRVNTVLRAGVDDPDGGVVDEYGRPVGWQWAFPRTRSTGRPFPPSAGPTSRLIAATRECIFGPRRPTSTRRAPARQLRSYRTTRSANAHRRLSCRSWNSFRACRTPEGATLTYTLSGPDAASFNIADATVGELRANAALDYETRTSYEVIVTATNPDGLSDSVTLTINVLDVNDPPEVSGPTAVTYAENDTTAVGTYEADDPENDPVTWSPYGADGGLFAIDGGVLRFAAAPDFEDPADAGGDNVYSVTVGASDGANPADHAVTVTVSNQEEPGTLSLSAEQPQVGTALTATLTDPDGSITGRSWKWERSENANTWSVITGETARSYTPAAADLNHYLRVTVARPAWDPAPSR